MDSDELVRRCKERLERTSNPSLPPEETLKAVIALGDEKWELYKEKYELEQQVAKLKEEINDANVKLVQAKADRDAAVAYGSDQAWIAAELGEFVMGIANLCYVGEESAAAKRVYDLNKGQIAKRMLNGYGYDSLKDAKEAYLKVCADKGLEYEPTAMLEWLFEHRPFQPKEGLKHG